MVHLYDYFIKYNNISFLKNNFEYNVLVKAEFGKNHLPDKYSELLLNLFNNEISSSLILIDNIISELNNANRLAVNTYQNYHIGNFGEIVLSGSTFSKYKFFTHLIRYIKQDFHLIDFGCSYGGIGLKIAQNFPASKVALNNINDTELANCDSMKNKLCLLNVNVTKKDVLYDNNSYDITLYFALVHHLLKTVTFVELVNLIKSQTRKFAIVEFPLIGDHLLEQVMKTSKTEYGQTYRNMENLDILTEKLKSDFKIIKVEKIDYNNNNLLRYGFILEKLIK